MADNPVGKLGQQFVLKSRQAFARLEFLGYETADCREWYKKKSFLTSEMAFRFENGDCSVIAGKSGVEIAYAVLEEAGKKFPSVMSRYSYNRSQEYWTGWVLAYYQWDTGLAFSDIENAIPIQEIRMLYEPYHEMDIRQLTETLLRLAKVLCCEIEELMEKV